MEKDFKNLLEGMNEAIKDLGAPSAEVLKEVFLNWDKIVGKNIAKFCQPIKFDNGVLILECSDFTWYSQFDFYKKMIESAIKDFSKSSKNLTVKATFRKQN
jgi:predicted nucleic acid-binding Zn ribbon protein